MDDTSATKKLGVAGGLFAVLAAGLAHGADDCARAGARVGAASGDDIARVAPVAAGVFACPGARAARGVAPGTRAGEELAGRGLNATDDLAALGAQRRTGAFGASDEALAAPQSGEKLGEELAERTLDAADLMLSATDGAEEDPESNPPADRAPALGPVTFITLHQQSLQAAFQRELRAAPAGRPVFVLGNSSKTNPDTIALAADSALSVAEIQRECLAATHRCIVLVCGTEAVRPAGSCLARARLAVTTAASKPVELADLLRNLLRERERRALDMLTIYRVADSADGRQIVRSLPPRRR
jgi:hypothetical protein